AEFLNPALHLVIDEQGRDNLPHSSTPSSDAEIDYLIERLRITGASFEMEDRRQQIVARLPRWRLSIDGDAATRNHEIKLQTEQPGSVSVQQHEAPVQELTADVLLQKRAAEIRSLNLKLQDSTLSLAGKLDSFKDPRFDFKAETDLALGTLAQFA